MNYLPLIFLLLFFSSCMTLSVRTSALTKAPIISYQDTVRIVNVFEDVPANSQLIGTITAGGFASYRSCLYDDLLGELRLEARLKGANIIEIEEFSRPKPGGNCFEIRGNLYRNEDAAALAAYDEEHRRLNASTLPDTADYALIHIYSPFRGGTGGFGQAIRLDGQRIFRLRNERSVTIHTNRFGDRYFRIPSLGSSGLILNVEPGQEYYLSFAMTYDGAFEVPSLFRIDNHVGRRESEGLVSREIQLLAPTK